MKSEYLTARNSGGNYFEGITGRCNNFTYKGRFKTCFLFNSRTVYVRDEGVLSALRCVGVCIDGGSQ